MLIFKAFINRQLTGSLKLGLYILSQTRDLKIKTIIEN